MKFSELSLVEGLRQGIEEAGFVECTPVQDLTFKEAFLGRDVLVQSQTGTGKTAAFLISIFQLFSTKPDRFRKALIIVPTRELAVQVEDEASLLGSHLSFRIGSIYGGVGYRKQERLIAEGVDVAVGTPGRLIDLWRSGTLKLDQFDTLVIDEADRMFDMGFYPDIRQILSGMPERSKRLTMLFSATLSTRVRNLAWEHMSSPAEIEVEPEHVTVEEITQELYHVTTKEKVRLLLGVLKKEQPRNALIFANTKYMVVELAKRLSHNGYPTEFIMGDLPQRQRLSIINGIKSGEIRFLVATDVAARGLHIEGLDLVINYDLPEDFEIYVHRIGRTARAGRTGKAISFACERYVYGLPAIETFIGMKIPVVWASDDMYPEDKSAGIDFRREIRVREEREGRGSPRTGRRGRDYAREDDREVRRPATGRGGARREEGGGEAPRPAVAGSGARKARPPRSGPPAEGRFPRETEAPRDGELSAERPSGSAPLEERLAYYRAKYGEDFGGGGPPRERQEGAPRPASDRPRSKGGQERRGPGQQRGPGAQRTPGAQRGTDPNREGKGRASSGRGASAGTGGGGPRASSTPKAGRSPGADSRATAPASGGQRPKGPSDKSSPRGASSRGNGPGTGGRQGGGSGSTNRIGPAKAPVKKPDTTNGSLLDRIKGLFRRK